MAELSTRAVHLRIEGRVQGVGFRWFVRERARRWGLVGWVRNDDDGSVLLAARGHSSGVDGLLDDLARGPDGAWVTGMEQLPVGPDVPFHDPFTIIR